MIGAVAGYYGGVIGAVLMRFVDAMLCFPDDLPAAGAGRLRQPRSLSITVIIAATAWMEVARVVEAQIRALREPRLRGRRRGARRVRTATIMFRELISNAIAPIVVAATLNVARAILLEAYVSFLGYGIQPPTRELGQHAGQRAGISDRRPGSRSSRAGDHAGGDQLQFPGRRAARCARPPARASDDARAVLGVRRAVRSRFRTDARRPGAGGERRLLHAGRGRDAGAGGRVRAPARASPPGDHAPDSAAAGAAHRAAGASRCPAARTCWRCRRRRCGEVRAAGSR